MPRNRKRKQSFPTAVPPPAPHLITRQKADADKREFVRRLRDDMTPAEKQLWQHLRGNRLGGLHFRRQQLVHGYVADFYCHAAGVVVEVDGGIHDTQIEQDTCRDAAFAVVGLLVLRVRNEEVTGNTATVLDRILATCSARITDPRTRSATPPDSSLPSLQGGVGGGSSEAHA